MFRYARLLIISYLTLSVLTLVAIVLLRNNPTLVTDAVWVRGTIVAATAVLMLLVAARAAKGSKAAYLRLRIITAVVLVAIVVVASLPGLFPVWMRIEQGVCGLLVAGAVVILNARQVRRTYSDQ
ncbi:MAG: hypothetical protein HOY71_45345 [Nonomuraea sp.]|nr:hypothetical protein [Nonomuraea sp.]